MASQESCASKLWLWKVFLLVFLITLVPGNCSRSPSPRHSWAVTIDVDALSSDEVKEVFGELEREYRVSHKGTIGILHDTFHIELSDEDSRALIEKRGLQDHHDALNVVSTSLDSHPAVRWHSYQTPLSRAKRDVAFNDPEYGSQWHLFNRRAVDHDVHVMSVWDQGITGHNVNVCVIDDGVDQRNKDIAANFNHAASYDYIDSDSDPTPDHLVSDDHGTKCAGVIASVANNSYCGVGVAFNAKISGIRILDRHVTDAREAKAFSHMIATNHIFSNSWGPNDDGLTVDGPGKLAQRVLAKAATKGRCGLGSIYVVASGNGGRKDNCNFDGYANSIYTVTIGSVAEDNSVPYYAEKCTAMFGVTYSSGNNGMRRITTTDVTWRSEGCSTGNTGLTGTSASAPMAAGMIALMLDARWCLTMRDVQHILVFTAVQFTGAERVAWVTNGAGFKYSDNFGFGLLQASRMVHAAKVWTTVPPQQNWATPHFTVQEPITDHLQLTEDVLQSDVGEEFKALEHVTVTVTITHSRRGALAVSLTSPSGTESVLGARRNSDMSKDGFKDWTFSTVLFWGESPAGRWTLVVSDKGSQAKAPHGTLVSWKLSLYGSNLSRHDIENRRRLIENASAPVQSCPERVFCEDTLYELPPSNASVFTLGNTAKYLTVLVLLVVAGILVYFIFAELYRRYKRKRLSLHPVSYSRTPLRKGSITEESAHLLGEEQVEQNNDQEVEADVATVSANDQRAVSPPLCLKEETSDLRQEAEEAIAVIAVKSHSPYLLSRMSDDEEEEAEKAHVEDPVVIHVLTAGPPIGDEAIHQSDCDTLGPSLVSFDEEYRHPTVVLEEVNDSGGGGGGGGGGRGEVVQQAQAEAELIAVDDVPVYQDKAGPEVEFGVDVFSENSKDTLGKLNTIA